MNKIFYKHYIFLDTINNLIEKNIKQFKKINIIVNTDQDEKKGLENELLIIKFAKKKKIPFSILENVGG